MPFHESAFRREIGGQERRVQDTKTMAAELLRVAAESQPRDAATEIPRSSTSTRAEHYVTWRRNPVLSQVATHNQHQRPARRWHAICARIAFVQDFCASRPIRDFLVSPVTIVPV